MRTVLFAVLVGCVRPVASPPADMPTDVPADATRHYTIWLGGARVGTAVEHERWTHAGVTLARVESLRFLREDAEVTLGTSIACSESSTMKAQSAR